MRSHTNNYNLLRLLLALLVVVSHSFELMDGDRHRELLTRAFGSYSFGELAVNSFFILSGYLITASWLSRPQLWPYLQKRLLRIVPGFAVAVAISLALVAPLVDADYWTDFPHTQFWPGLLTLDFQPPETFIGLPYPLLNGALWTIHYEFFCYLMLAAIGYCGLLRHRTWVTAAMALGMAGYIGYLVTNGQGWLPSWGGYGRTLTGYQHYIRFIPLYLVGVCWYLWREHLRLSWPLTAAAMALFALLMCHPYTAPLAMTLPWVYLLFVLGNIHFPPARAFDRNDFSYGAYLYAWPVQQLLIWYQVTGNPWLLMLLTLLCVTPLAALSWFLIERPCLRLKPVSS